MEFKHFSHDHGLTLYHMAEGSETVCSGCKLPGLTTVYMCWQCQYFLHQQCFEAKRSIVHPSHPIHPLNLLPCSTYPSSTFLCNSCNHSGTGFSYACSHCEFDIHLHCAYTTSQSHPYSVTASQTLSSHFTYPSQPPEVSEPYPPGPQPVQLQPYHYQYHAENAPVIDHAYPSVQQPHHPHVPPYNASNGGHVDVPPYNMLNHESPANPNLTNSYPIENQTDSNKTQVAKHFSHQHALRLQRNIEEEEEEEDDGVLCSGCEHAISESSPAYTCTKSKFCKFRLHKSCFDLPMEIKHRSHMAHPLTLLSAPPYESYSPEFTCNACFKRGYSFVYHCSSCKFDLHVNCAVLPDSVKRDDHEHPLSLLFSSPYEKSKHGENEAVFMCDVCQNSVDCNCWVYYCKECDFGTDVGCINEEMDRAEEEREGGEDNGAAVVVDIDGLTQVERLMKMQNEFQLMQFRMQMNQRLNQSIISMGHSLCNI